MKLRSSDQTLEPIQIPGVEKPYPQAVPALEERFPEKILDLNLRAFAAGRHLRAAARS